ncbi:MAG: BON domain-containing protein [Planctomycetia bacterium]
MSISRSTFLMAVVVSSMLTVPAWAGDLAAGVATKLRDSGALVGYRVNVKAKSGTVWLEGTVSDEKQLAAAVGIAETTPGVERVVNRLVVDGPSEQPQVPLGVPASAWGMAGVAAPQQEPVAAAAEAAKKPQLNPFAFITEGLFPAKPAQDEELQPEVQLVAGTVPTRQRAGTPQPRPPQYMPAARGVQPMRPAAGQASRSRSGVRPASMGEPMMLPPGGLQDGQIVPGTMQYSDGGYAGGQMGGPMGMPQGPVAGGPMPMGGTGVGMPPVPQRGDGPNMPNYAWPSYASSPNYAAVQYPTQYSPTAWPYIGPFYPYPQVPLGWRRVSLEWDDGWWWLDFDERHIHSHHR